MADTLRLMSTLGYAPRLVIDAGANLGQWSILASAIFPDARFHLIEPQPGCQARLSTFEAPRFSVYPVAVTGPGVSSVRMVSAAGAAADTGAHVTTETLRRTSDARPPTPDVDVMQRARRRSIGSSRRS